jgi:mRNA-degrading endonuclease RelE of RelBE toxin-antitoxin system
MEIKVQPSFTKAIKKLIKKYPSIPLDFAFFLENLPLNYQYGDALGQDCYKIRMAISSKNKGKSGGARVIACVKIIQDRIYLLSIYDKSEKESISVKTLNELLTQLDK